MVAKQRIRMANEKHSKNITQRGNVAKTTVSLTTTVSVEKSLEKWLKWVEMSRIGKTKWSSRVPVNLNRSETGRISLCKSTVAPPREKEITKLIVHVIGDQKDQVRSICWTDWSDGAAHECVHLLKVTTSWSHLNMQKLSWWYKIRHQKSVKTVCVEAREFKGGQAFILVCVVLVTCFNF